MCEFSTEYDNSDKSIVLYRSFCFCNAVLQRKCHKKVQIGCNSQIFCCIFTKEIRHENVIHASDTLGFCRISCIKVFYIFNVENC